MNAAKMLGLSLSLLMASAADAAEVSKSAANQDQPELLENMAKLSPSEIERQLPAVHPANYYMSAGQLWAAGKKDPAVFWLYAGQLRYRFYLLSNPAIEPSGDPALFASLQETIAKPINLFAGSDPKRWMQQIDAVLEWDSTNRNGFTSKADHSKELDEVRGGLVKMRDYIGTHIDDIRREREQQGIGEVGVTNGVYVEVRKEKMPKD